MFGAGTLLLLPERTRLFLTPWLVAFAAGALLGAALLVLVPEALHAGEFADDAVLATVLGGIIFFFIAETLLMRHHCHTEGCPTHGAEAGLARRSTAILVLVGDALHNLVDGAVIAVAFLADPRLGVAATLAVAAHELPHEVGDVAVLLAAGYRRGRALWLNLLSGLAALVGGTLGYLALAGFERLLPLALALAAGGFIYIALADLLPRIQERPQPQAVLVQAAAILLGLAAVQLADWAAH